MTNKFQRRRAAMRGEGGYEALQSMLKGEYTDESTDARTIRQSGGKDRHSKVFTARGPRDRRVRLSVATAIRFYDLQDRLGFEQPSKAVEWLLLHCQPSIQALPQLASLHPLRIMSIPQAAHMANHPHKHRMQQDTGQDNHKKPHQNQKRCLVDTAAHQHRELNFQGFNLTTSQLPSFHNGTFPFRVDGNHVQESAEEGLPPSSNPSSSDCEGSPPEAPTVIMAQPTASMTGIHRCSSSFTPHKNSHMNKEHSIQHYFRNEHDKAKFASHSAGMATLSLCAGKPPSINSGLSSSVKSSSFYNLTNFNENSVLTSNTLHPEGNGDLVQPITRIPSTTNHTSNQYKDITQLFFTSQANQFALNDHNQLIGSAYNQCRLREGGADVKGQAYTIDYDIGSTYQLYNQIAFQQGDELACSDSMYVSPSPGESTAINTLAAEYSNTACNHMVDDHAVNTLYTGGWNPPGQLQ